MNSFLKKHSEIAGIWRAKVHAAQVAHLLFVSLSALLLSCGGKNKGVLENTGASELKVTQKESTAQTAKVSVSQNGADAAVGTSHVEAYQSADPSKESRQFSVEVMLNGVWTKTATYEYSRKSIDPSYFQGESPRVHWATIGTSSEVSVRIRRLAGTFSSVQIQPSRYGISPTLSPSFITFKIRKSQKVFVKIDNQIFDTLFVFANPPKPTRPANAKYFGKGIHHIGVNYRLSSGERNVYLDEGAWVIGSFNLTDAGGNVKIMGPGVLSGEFATHEQVLYKNGVDGEMNAADEIFKSKLIHVDRLSENTFGLTVSGITMVGSPEYNMRLKNLLGKKLIENVHILSPWTYNTDGLSVGSNAEIKDVFVFNNDDTIHAEYSNKGSINVTNAVLAGRNAVLVGYGKAGGSKPYSTNITNIDMLLVKPYVGFHAQLDGEDSGILIEKQIYKNVTVDGEMGQFLRLKIEDTPWGAPGNKAKGNIQNISFENVRVLGKQISKSEIAGLDGQNRIQNITFKDLNINGTMVTQNNFANFFDINSFTKNITFIVSKSGVTCTSLAGASKFVVSRADTYYVDLSPSKGSSWVISGNKKVALNCFTGSSIPLTAEKFKPSSEEGKLCLKRGLYIEGLGSPNGYGTRLTCK